MSIATLPQPVFIVGSGRSGTTITASLVNRLPGIHIAKETGYLTSLPQDTSAITEQSVSEEFLKLTNSWLEAEQWHGRATAQDFRSFCQRHALSGVRGWIYYIWQLDCETPLPQLTFLGDNTPNYIFLIPWLEQVFPDARYVHLIRDPRDVVSSVIRMKFGANNPVQAALDWHHWIGTWLMAEKIVPADRRIEVRYEDLCSDTAASLPRIATFLGLSVSDADDAIRRYSESQGLSADFGSVAKLKHHARLNQPISRQSIGRYRTELTEKQIADVESIAQCGMLAYGYEPSKWHVSPVMAERRVHLLNAGIRDFAGRMLRFVMQRSFGLRQQRESRASVSDQKHSARTGSIATANSDDRLRKAAG